MVWLYIAPIQDGPMGTVWPPQRQAQLDETKNEAHRRQRYTAWKLLEHALFHSLGLDLRQLQLSLNHRGRWSCGECFFSLAHSKNAVAVAVSTAPVGIDLEALDRPLHPGLWKKLLTAPEETEFAPLTEPEKKLYLLQKWCTYESLFKWREAAGPQPEPPCKADTVTVAGETYCYAVASRENVVRKLLK